MMLANGQAAPFGPGEHVPLARFLETVPVALERGARLIAYFGMANPVPSSADDRLVLIAVLGWDESGRIEVLSAFAGTEVPSMAGRVPVAARFEREIAEQLGVVLAGHGDLRPIRGESGANKAPEETYTFHPIVNPAVHEVAVGPVHAGVIEPGHFRFQCLGETVLQLEIMLGYQHRGAERSLLGEPGGRQLAAVQEIAGDSTVGHTLAYCQLVEAMSGMRAPPRSLAIRACALELERMANHVGDIGALAGDIGYQPTAAVCGRLRGAVLNLTAQICGNRFGRWLLAPGGVRGDIDHPTANLLVSRLHQATQQFVRAADRFLDNPGALHRMEGTGAIEPEAAVRLGAVGVVARACGLPHDVRHDYSHDYYRLHQIPVATAADGDVYARALVRRIEAMRASEFVREALVQLPEGETSRPCGPVRQGMIAVSLVEAWRGALAHIGISDGRGRIIRYKVVDPSFRNWAALELAMRGQQISDFPLCNKSFNLSYAGHDL